MKPNMLTLVVIAALLFSCSASNMTYSSEKLSTDGYGNYKKYAFLPTTDTQYAKLVNRSLFVPILAREAKDLLDKKGMILDTLNPDVLFTYHLVMNRKYEANQQQETVYKPEVLTAASIPMYDTYGGGVSGSSAMRAGTAPGSNIYYFSSNNRPYTYNGKMTIDTLRAGSMVIDMIDAKTNKIVWRSVAEGKQYESSMPTMEQAVKTILPQMMKKFPKK